MCSRQICNFTGNTPQNKDARVDYLEVNRDVELTGRSLCCILAAELHEFIGLAGGEIVLTDTPIPILCLVYENIRQLTTGGIQADTTMGTFTVSKSGYYRVDATMIVNSLMEEHEVLEIGIIRDGLDSAGDVHPDFVLAAHTVGFAANPRCETITGFDIVHLNQGETLTPIIAKGLCALSSEQTSDMPDEDIPVDVLQSRVAVTWLGN